MSNHCGGGGHFCSPCQVLHKSYGKYNGQRLGLGEHGRDAAECLLGIEDKEKKTEVCFCKKGHLVIMSGWARKTGEN